MQSICKVVVQTEAFDTGAEIDALHVADPRVGAVASFVGAVRDVNDEQAVRTLTLEHYAGMTEKAIRDIVDQAAERWVVYRCTVIHRVGTLGPTERIVFVGVASAHRGDAFAACEFIMDYLKTKAPFWKKETTGAGERWVASRESDAHAAARWKTRRPAS